MKNRALIPLAVGLVVGLIAVKYSVDVVKKARAGSANDDMVRIVVAQQSIPMGVEIKQGMLSISKAGRALAPQGSFDDASKLTGRVVRSPIPKGLPVIEEMLAAPGTPAGMASLVPSGYRAVAVKVDEYSSVAGFLKPGCRVDVVAVMSVKGANNGSQMISRVILQDVTIGAVGQSLTGEADTTAANISRSVTVLVKPEEVPILHLAATQGQIRLAMRHYEDAVNGTTNVATESELSTDKPKTQDKESFLSGLAKIFQNQQQIAPSKPNWASQEQNKAKPLVVNYPYVMTVISGSAVQTVAFENGSSVRRVDANAPRGQNAAAMASANGYDAATREPARPESAERNDVEESLQGH